MIPFTGTFRSQLLVSFSCLLFILGVFACTDATTSSDKGTVEASNDSIAKKNPQSFLYVENSKQWKEEWSKENRLIFHVKSTPSDMHPTNANGSARFLVNEYIHRKIVSNDLENLSIRPDIVVSMPEVSEDALEFTYELKKEPTWDDGQVLSVDDIIFFFKVHKCPLVDNPDAKPYFKSVKDVIAIEGQPGKFKVIMKQPYIQNISFLAEYPLIQRAYHDPDNILGNYTISQFDQKGFDASKEAPLVKWANSFNDPKNGHDPEFFNGLGAYKVTAWEPGERLVLEKKANHWTGELESPSIYDRAYLETIIFKVNRDNASSLLELKSQDMDVSFSVSTPTLLDLQNDPEFSSNYHAHLVDAFAFTFMALNNRPQASGRTPFFEDKKVRRAMALLTPVEDIIALNYKGNSRRRVSAVSSLKRDFNSSLQPIVYDVEQAKKLLDEAGWVDSDGDQIRDKKIGGKQIRFSFELLHVSSPGWLNMAKLIKESMAEAGVEVVLVGQAPPQLTDNAYQHQFDALLLASEGDSKPDDHTQLWHTSSWKNNGSNFCGFGNAESDALIDSINVAVDSANYLRLSHKFQRLVYEEQPMVFMAAPKRRAVIHKRFGNAHLYFERPGILLSNLKLLAPEVADSTAH